MPKPIQSLIVASGIALAAGSASGDANEELIRNGFHEKAAMTQLMRWYQFYENPGVGIAHQLDILTDDVSITSPSGTAKGHGEYKIGVRQFPDSWQNAHDLRNAVVTVNEDGTLGLTAEIIYSNLGMADGVVAQHLGYQATLVYEDSVLPRFRDITITPKGPAQVGAFKDTYVQNRLTSLVNYWVTLVEHPGRDAAPFREILAPVLDIKFSADGETFTSYDDIAVWVAGPVSSLPATRHEVGPIRYRALGDSRYELTVGFDWTGLRPDDMRMTAKTLHTWIVTDDPGERFARVEKIRVEMIEPFAVVEQ